MTSRQYGVYWDLLSPDFTFVNEGAETSETGRQREQVTFKRIVSTYRGIDFNLYVSSRTEADDGCLVVCGLIEMRLFQEHDSGFIVNDETCLTICPNSAGELWYLTEWRLVRGRVHPVNREDGFELVTWGEIRHFAQEDR